MLVDPGAVEGDLLRQCAAGALHDIAFDAAPRPVGVDDQPAPDRSGDTFTERPIAYTQRSSAAVAIVAQVATSVTRWHYTVRWRQKIPTKMRPRSRTFSGQIWIRSRSRCNLLCHQKTRSSPARVLARSIRAARLRFVSPFSSEISTPNDPNSAWTRSQAPEKMRAPSSENAPRCATIVWRSSRYGLLIDLIPLNAPVTKSKFRNADAESASIQN